MKELPCQEKKTYADLVEDIVTQIVSKPDSVDVVEASDDSNWLKLVVTVDKDDKGPLIGKGGATIGAISTILNVISHGKKISIDIA